MKPKKAKKNEEVKMEELEGKAENEENAVVPGENAKREENSVVSEEKQETAEKESFVKELLSWICTIAIALFLGWFLSKVVLFNANVPTTSMESTIMKDDNLIGFRLAYKFQEPKRGDVVIFPYPDDPKINYVKRIIGMPGETVEIHDGGVYINGEILDETGYLKVTTEGDFGPFVVPEDSYFMMGDNRNFSLDSRYWENKYVKKEDIIAKVIFRYYPSIGKIE